MSVTKPEFHESIVVDARDLPPEVVDWCIDNDHSTHYVDELVRIWDKDAVDNPLLEWLKSEGVDIEKYHDPYGIYLVSIIGT